MGGTFKWEIHKNVKKNKIGRLCWEICEKKKNCPTLLHSPLRFGQNFWPKRIPTRYVNRLEKCSSYQLSNLTASEFQPLLTNKMKCKFKVQPTSLKVKKYRRFVKCNPLALFKELETHFMKQYATILDDNGYDKKNEVDCNVKIFC